MQSNWGRPALSAISWNRSVTAAGCKIAPFSRTNKRPTVVSSQASPHA
jgi:hypothetical protein